MIVNNKNKNISTKSILKDRITSALMTTVLEIGDDTHLHKNHLQGPKFLESRGGGHFRALIVSRNFHGLSLVERHRLVYEALGDLMGGRIHAFSMKTLTPNEYKKSSISRQGR